MLLGYIVYLSISLCTGELFENIVEFLVMYFPEYEAYYRSFLPPPPPPREDSSHNRSIRESRASQSRSRRVSTSLFDDIKRDGELPEHIVGADMAMSEAPYHHDQESTTLIPSTTKNGDSFVDFNMDFRKTTTDETQREGLQF